MGFGPIAQPPGEEGFSVVVAGGGGAGSDRANAQGVGRLHLRSTPDPDVVGFEMGGGVLYSGLFGYDGSEELSVLPFLEPGFGIGPFRLTVPLSGFAFGAGGGGIVYGVAGLTIAYVTPEITLGATVLAYTVDVTAEDGVKSDAQLVTLSFAWYRALDDDGIVSLLLGADVAAGQYSLDHSGIRDDLDGPFFTGLAYLGLGLRD
jgi:hypothetical protein